MNLFIQSLFLALVVFELDIFNGWLAVHVLGMSLWSQLSQTQKCRDDSSTEIDQHSWLRKIFNKLHMVLRLVQTVTQLQKCWKYIKGHDPIWHWQLYPFQCKTGSYHAISIHATAAVHRHFSAVDIKNVFMQKSCITKVKRQKYIHPSTNATPLTCGVNNLRHTKVHFLKCTWMLTGWGCFFK